MFAPTYPIHTSRLDLRPFGESDLDALRGIHGDPAVVRYLYWDPLDDDGARVMLARKMRRTALIDEGDSLSLAVVERDTGEVAGDAMLRWRSEKSRQGEIGYVFGTAFHGRGYATEVGAELLRIGFADVGLHRIVGSLNGRNAASARVLERLGMRKEAQLVHSEQVKGEWADEVIYAILEDEWRATAADAS